MTTTIYQVTDIINHKTYFYVPDNATQSEGEALNIPNATWIVGDKTAADSQLQISQTNFLNSDIPGQHMSQVVSVGQDTYGHNIWKACDITKETPNTDSIYELFVGVLPGFQRAVGTTEAMNVYKTHQQELLSWAGLDTVNELSGLPKPTLLKPKVPTTS